MRVWGCLCNKHLFTKGCLFTFGAATTALYAQAQEDFSARRAPTPFALEVSGGSLEHGTASSASWDHVTISLDSTFLTTDLETPAQQPVVEALPPNVDPNIRQTEDGAKQEKPEKARKSRKREGLGAVRSVAKGSVLVLLVVLGVLVVRQAGLEVPKRLLIPPFETPMHEAEAHMEFLKSLLPRTHCLRTYFL